MEGGLILQNGLDDHFEPLGALYIRIPPNLRDAQSAANVFCACFMQVQGRSRMAPSPRNPYQPHCGPGDLIFSITWSRVKLAAFWRGGNSWKVCRNFPTYACAGTKRKARSRSQS
jgi:hypothetical protein